jgi:hypothetical protein
MRLSCARWAGPPTERHSPRLLPTVGSPGAPSLSFRASASILHSSRNATRYPVWIQQVLRF